MMTSNMAMASSLNPDAPMFIPAAFRRKVEEYYSPERRELVKKTTAWFRQDLAGGQEHVDDVAALLPDDADDLFYAPPPQHDLFHEPVLGGDVLRNTALNSPWGGSVARSPKEQRYVGAKGGDPRRRIHQPR